MAIKSFFSWSIATAMIGVAAVIPNVSSTIAAEGVNATAMENDGEKISFGLPKIPVRNLPDELNDRVDDKVDQVDNRVDRVESNIRNRIPNVLLPLIKEHLLSRERTRLMEWSN